MKITEFLTPGKLGGADVYNVSDVRGGDAYLFVYPDVTFLYDSGFGFSAEAMCENIRKILGERPLDYVLLTHSHYDHALGSAAVRRFYPDVKVVGASYAAKILEKPSARTTMLRLDRAAAEFHESKEVFKDIDLLFIDIEVEDKDLLKLGTHEAEVVFLPGHTRDSIGYYFKDSKIMLGCETLGIAVEDGLVIPNFLVGFRMTLDSLKKVGEYDMEAYLVPHVGAITGQEEIKDFLKDSYRCHLEAKDLIVSSYQQGKGIEEILEEFQKVFFNERVYAIYPPAAYSENLHIEIPMVLAEEGFIKIEKN